MLRLKQVAERLQCSLSNVYALVQSGRLPVVTTGARGKGYRVSEDDLAKFLAGGKRGGPSPAALQPQPPRPRLKHLNLGGP